jgi:hypothetical protein
MKNRKTGPDADWKTNAVTVKYGTAPSVKRSITAYNAETIRVKQSITPPQAAGLLFSKGIAVGILYPSYAPRGGVLNPPHE